MLGLCWVFLWGIPCVQFVQRFLSAQNGISCDPSSGRCTTIVVCKVKSMSKIYYKLLTNIVIESCELIAIRTHIYSTIVDKRTIISKGQG